MTVQRLIRIAGGMNMADLSSISPNELSIAATAVAIAIAEGRTADEVNVLGNFITAIGSILTTIAAQEANLENIKKAYQKDKDRESKS